MNRFAVTLLVIVAGTAATAPQAAAIDLGLGLFKKKPKAEPPSRIKQLVATLQTDPDERKRLTAAEELRSFDPRHNPEMVPALITSLQQDPSPAVRAQAAETLGRLKPVDQPAGLVLEAAQETDPAAAVREAAKSALWQYHLNGYRRPTSVTNVDRTPTPEPPLAARRPTTTTVSKSPTRSTEPGGFRPIPNGVGRTSQYQQTNEPPLAKPRGGSYPVIEATPTVTATPAPTMILPSPQPSAGVPNANPQPAPTGPIPQAMPSAPTIGVPTITPPPLPTMAAPPTITAPPGH